MLDRATDVVSLVAGRGVHLGSLPAVLAERYGERPAIHDEAPTPRLHQGGTRTFADLEEATARLAAALAGLGVHEGDRVLVLVENRLDVLLHTWALARIGAVASPVNPRLKTDEVVAVVAATAADAAIVDAEVHHRHGDAVGDLRWIDAGDEDAGVGIAGWLAAHPDERCEAVERDAEATVLLPTTSGTTGMPKAAALTSHGLLASIGRLVAAPVGRQRRPRADRDRALAALPLTHIMGYAVALASLCAGVELLHRRRFDADGILDTIERQHPNVFVGVPTMYADLEEAGAAERDLSSIQLWISSADAMPEDRARRFQRYGATGRLKGKGVGTAWFLDIYGMVELSGAAAVRVYPPSPISRFELPSLATVLPGIEVRAVDEDGEPVGWGEVGQLQFRGAGVLEGYEGHEEGPDDDGWFPTGDHGRVWPGGLFAFAGRRRDRLKVGGFSVFPAEVETELRQAPHVREVALVGIPDDRLGERPVALVVPEDGFDAEAFLQWAERHVAGYRRPRQVAVVEEIPRGNHGKVARGTATELANEHLSVGEVGDT
ncbi:MAG: class I adenylate-forming enzyme family protein [Nitriliruptorales bacterium]|nr:class I adenylate-forming enzyme family protein [Nitriliruptorales bacterium]